MNEPHDPTPTPAYFFLSDSISRILRLNLDEQDRIERAMLAELRRCGSNPSPRFCRTAFAAAMKQLHVTVECDRPTNPNQPRNNP